MARKQSKVVLAVHGGAGAITADYVKGALESRLRKKLEQSLSAGYRVLSGGGSSIDAVVAAVRVLEDSPLFNAGKGSVLTNSGKVEMDAAVMDGSTLASGAVGAITIAKNPVSVAKVLMDESDHVFLIGKGADAFARRHEGSSGIKIVDRSFFETEKRKEQLQRARRRALQTAEKTRVHGVSLDERKYGTVGAVALDASGNLAAATSTGGTMNKHHGRIGDTPIIGAGTYADNATCAVSATGQGEYFMRRVTAYDLSALMKYAHLSVEEAARRAIHQSIEESGGQGGVIALDAKGNCAMDFNTSGMFRGCVTAGGDIQVAIFAD